MATEITLYAAHAAIMAAVDTELKANTDATEPLEDLTAATIWLGNKQKRAPKPPMLWIQGMPATIGPEERTGLLTIGESWSLPLLLLGLAQSNDPAVGYDLAAKIAAGARTVLLRTHYSTPILGLTYISDILSTGFDPEADEQVDEERGRLFAATAMVTVRFSIVEPSA